MPFRASRSKTWTPLFIILNLLIGLSLACSLPGFGGDQGAVSPSLTAEPTWTPAPPTPTPQPLPPELVESNPAPGGEISLNGPIRLYFNQPMDRASVEAALSLPIDVQGGLTWVDDATLVIAPQASLAPQSEVDIRIDTQARAHNGLPLQEPIDLNYRTVGYLRAAQTLPEPGATEVDPASAVVAGFNRPIVPLGDAEESLQAFTILDASGAQPAGSGEWVNTSIYVFHPDPPLRGGTRYMIQLNPGLQGTDGSPLESLPVWAFTTAAPQLLSLDPPDGSQDLRLDAQIALTFNQAMDPVSVSENFSMAGPDAGQIPGRLEWNEAFTVATFLPDQLLQRNTEYLITLGAQARARGGTSLSSGLQASLRTAAPLALIGSTPAQGGEKPAWSGVTMNFNGPVQADNLVDYLSIEPAVSNLTATWNPEQRAMNIYADFEPMRDYAIRVSAELPDPWGGTLSQEAVLNFHTLPLEPQLFSTNGSDVLFLTPQDSSLDMQATNITNLSLSRGRVPLGDFIAMVSGPDSYNLRQAYRAPDATVWTQPLDAPANRSQSVELEVASGGTPLDLGLYYLRFNHPNQNISQRPLLLVVGSAHLTFKISATDALVWAVDSNELSPLADQIVSLYDSAGRALASGQTDADGVYRTSFPPRDDPYGVFYAVLGAPDEPHFGMALSNWDQGVSNWQFDIRADYRPPRLEAYIYTDRPIYRPGQTVYFRAVARQAYNGRYSLPDMATLPLTLYQDYGQELATFDLPLDAFGAAHGGYTIPPEAKPGIFRLGNDALELGGGVTFQVAEYRKPEIDLQVSFATEQALAGDTLTAEVSARYFFGAPAGNVPLKWTLYEKPDPLSLPGYQVGPVDTGWLQGFPVAPQPGDLGVPIAQGEGATDSQGLTTLEAPTEAVKDRKLYTLEVTVQDESGLPVSARAQMDLNPAEFFIGLRPDSWVGRAEQEMGFDVLAIDWTKEPAGSRSLRAEFQKVIWLEEQSDQFYGSPKFTPQYTPIGSTDFATSQDGLARLAFTPPEPGVYQLDILGENALTQIILWVGGQGQAVWPNLPNQGLRLSADRESYQPGDQARVFVPNPFEGSVPALVTVERGLVMSHQVIALDGGGETLQFDLTSEEAPNVYISVTLLGRRPDGRPDFRQGYLDLEVAPLDKELKVELTRQPQSVGPGEQITFEIRVIDSSGNPVQAEFSLSVVDKAVLALADPNAPDILPAFYGDQPLGVRTGIALAAYAHRRSTSPLGMGGGGGGEMVEPVVREQFPDTAYWNAEITTDADGRAQVELPLPDSLTTWQVSLRGVDADTRLGQAETQIVVSKDLLLRPVAPRFAVVGDHFPLAAVVHNNTAQDLQVEVSIQTSGFSLDDPESAARQVLVPANSRGRVDWWGVVEDVEEVDVAFSAQSGSLQDAARLSQGPLPVLHYTVPQTFRTSGVMDEAGERLEVVSLPRSFEPGGGRLQVELAPSLSASMMSALDVLEQYPYECTEQTLSRFLPNLEMYLAVQQFGLEGETLQARLGRTLDQGLNSLIARQNPDGGWSWWQGGDSDPYVTAYVLFGLRRAQQAGVTVSGVIIRSAYDFLLATQITPEMAPDNWQLNRLAFEYFAMTNVDTGYLPGVDALYQSRARLSPWAQALLALAAERQSPGNEMTRTLLSDLQTTAIRSSTGVHWEVESSDWRNMITPVTSNAMIVYALSQRDPGAPLLADAVRYLSSQRQPDGAWDSTYSTAWSLLALTEVMKGTGEMGGDFTFSASLNGAPLASGEAAQVDCCTPPVSASPPLGELYPDDPNALLIQRGAGTGRLYYTVGLQVNQSVEVVEPVQRGVSISRAYYPSGQSCPEPGCAPLDSARGGDLVDAHLTLTLEHQAYYLVVEDYIPAGAEILDASLKTSQQVPQGESEEQPLMFDPQRPFQDGWGWWLFNQPRLYDDRITWSVDYLPAGTYELTYTLVNTQAGEYRVLPARAWQFYFPEVQGASAGELFTIQP